MPFAPHIPDRAGRGALCAQIDQLVKDFTRLNASGSSRDRHEAKRVEHRLDQARRAFHALYRTPLPTRE